MTTQENINFTGNADSFHWTNDNTAIGLAASGTGNIASFIATTQQTLQSVQQLLLLLETVTIV